MYPPPNTAKQEWPASTTGKTAIARTIVASGQRHHFLLLWGVRWNKQERCIAFLLQLRGCVGRLLDTFMNSKHIWDFSHYDMNDVSTPLRFEATHRTYRMTGQMPKILALHQNFIKIPNVAWYSTCSIYIMQYKYIHIYIYKKLGSRKCQLS